MDVLIKWIFSFVCIGVIAELGYMIGDVRKYIQSKTGKK